jgi:hypothetical protein
MEGLAERAREAAPHPSGGPHVSAAEIERMRVDDESEDLDTAYRHLASCAACRARLLEPAVTLHERVAVAFRVAAEGAGALREAARRLSLTLIERGPGRFVVFAPPAEARALVTAVASIAHEWGESSAMPLVADDATLAIELEAWQALEAKGAARTNVVPLRREHHASSASDASSARAARSRKATAYGWGAAAAIVLLVGAAMFVKTTPSDEPIAIAQRAYVGMMGEGDAAVAAVAPEDRNVELSFAAPARAAAALVTIDAAGRPIAPVRGFTRGADGRLAVVIAPRTFAAHAGSAVGRVLWGDADRVREAMAKLGEVKEARDGYEGFVRAEARAHGVRVERVTIGAAD